MKRTLLIIFLIVTNLACIAQKTTFTQAIEYNDYIVGYINEVDQAYLNSLQVKQGKEYCMTWTDSLSKVTTRSLGILKLVAPFDGEKNFIGSANGFIKYMNTISKKSLIEFDKLLFADNLTATMAKKLDSMATKLDADYSKYFDKIEVAQKALSVKYGFAIEGQ